MVSKVRLHVDHPLGSGQTVPLTQPQAHYLFSVMRMTAGGVLSLFNGKDGEWDAEVVEAGKRGGILVCRAQTRPLQLPPDLWLLFAPIKKARTDFIVEKAVEMGAARVLPVQTDYTNADRIRGDRLQAHAVEAAEQCGGTFVPEVAPLERLSKLIDKWDPARRIMMCDEAEVGQPLSQGSDNGPTVGAVEGPWAILIGPEGGFSPAERSRLRALSFVQVTSLGPRILRADTAAVAALTLWQLQNGDWR
ncbi:MAG: 16S rRNA (uracil(1498)-N(3))-methyltransferase [Flavimaricola sp.]|nr:16S rRNA (uracil(1498)-N(3))-methyltransferase [Flavimaricola sp.]